MKTQQALEQEKYILDALMERIPDFIYFKDKESHFIRVNHALAERIGVVSPGEIIGKSDFDLFTEEHAQEAYADEKLIIETGASLLGKEEKENWVDGKLTWSSSSKMPLFDSGGQVVGTFGMSRDDSAGFLRQYDEQSILEKDPFVSIDIDGVGELVEIGATRGRATRPDLKIGICGEHGGDPASIEFCHRVGMDYVSCSPYRVPIARLAAAQAALKK